jgi:hypothetical protein
MRFPDYFNKKRDIGERWLGEYRKNKRRFLQFHRVFRGHQTVVNLRFDAALA